MEDSIGSDAKDIQRLRLDLHQERMKNKRLALKLEETESLAQKPKEDFPKREEPRSPIKEMDLNIKTNDTGNRYVIQAGYLSSLWSPNHKSFLKSKLRNI